MTGKVFRLSAEFFREENIARFDDLTADALMI
jgi:hypothetical protein